jgi:hypothetical protein
VADHLNYCARVPPTCKPVSHKTCQSVALQVCLYGNQTWPVDICTPLTCRRMWADHVNKHRLQSYACGLARPPTLPASPASGWPTHVRTDGRQHGQLLQRAVSHRCCCPRDSSIASTNHCPAPAQGSAWCHMLCQPGHETAAELLCTGLVTFHDFSAGLPYPG